MNTEWGKKLLKISNERENPGMDKEFVDLVYQAEDNCSLETARVLMKTFFDKDDYGTQESVNSVFASANKEIVIQALLEELPRLAKEAPEWAHCLIGTELKFRPELLKKIATQMPAKIKNILEKIIENKKIMNSDPKYRKNSEYRNLINNISSM
ncbi:hypothetical protein [Candidatus Paracaedibacter symbiosus]|uniref:hypothetical protein n=1 Tax=Candidatus Paracaedibacter symbiosus TaxID=244582 RepID=UPI000690C1D9|nr:hypothetical protein [Candidatus Paracaedibacter symbiosus]